MAQGSDPHGTATGAGPDAGSDGRHVAPGGWKRAIIGLLVGALVGAVIAFVLPRDDLPRRRGGAVPPPPGGG